MSKRSYPTAGLCYYTIKLILNYLVKDESTVSTLKKTLKLMLLSKFECYFFSDDNQLKLLKKYSFFDPLGFSVLGEDDVRIIEQEIKQVVRNESIHLNDPFSTSSSESIPSTLQPIVTASASQTSASDHKQSLSTIDQFLLACGESPISNLQKSQTRKLTIDDELCVYKEVVSSFFREHKTQAFALEFWKQNYSNFPILAQLARAYLSTKGKSSLKSREFKLYYVSER
ncbi:unnamed protein product [Adineta ricciae]|uniref:HAT C-terminal dimerisation domain-containing protein n=1 Tax=Adineta ricciae TaxID=249248 RepID=A0A815TQQ0_ADIRI|nr:unnamed protein product [Adineta ricciae]